jgi:hypothetical protein
MFSDRYMLGDERFYPISGDKWVTNTLKNINSSRPQASPWWGRMQSKGPVILAQLFFLEGGEEVCAFWDFLCSQCVPIMFSICSHSSSQCVLIMFSMFSHNVPNAFPTCSQCASIYPIVTYIGERANGNFINITIFGSANFYLGWWPKFQNSFFVMGQWMMGNCQKKKKGGKKKGRLACNL